MRAIKRQPLGVNAQAYLSGREKASWRLTLGHEEIEKKWDSARRTKSLKAVVLVLRKMAGPTARCMYCVDSHGCDIDHFWPKSKYPEKMFRWENMLLSCTECGRIKGTRFPVKDGLPLLIDPTVEDPWDSLEFQPDTGHITARFDKAANRYIEKGELTVDVLMLSEREELAEGYKRTWRRLEKCVELFLQGGLSESAFTDDIRDADDHGLLGWCLSPSGAQETPFRELKTQYPGIWQQLQEKISSRHAL